MADERIQAARPTAEQLAVLESLRRALARDAAPARTGAKARPRPRTRARTASKRGREERNGTRAR